MKREPVLTAATLTAAVAAVIGLLVSFGLDVTQGQTEAILTAVGVVFPIVAGLLARSSVTPVDAPKNSAGIPLIPDTLYSAKPGPVVPDPTIVDPDAGLD